MTRAPLWQKAPDGSWDMNATLKVLCIYLTMGLFSSIGLGALVSLIYQWTHDGKALDPSGGWITVLGILLGFIATALGVTGYVTVGKSKTAPLVAQAEAIRETTKAKVATGEFLATPTPNPPAPLADVTLDRIDPIPPEVRERVSPDEIP